MRIMSNNLIGTPGSAMSRVMGGHRQTSRRDMIIQQRLQDNKREMKIREREDKQLMKIHEKMAQVKNSDMNEGLKWSILDGLTDKITRIHEKRAERETLAAEREMARTKALLDEIMRPDEDNERSSLIREAQKTPEEAERANQRDMLMGMTRIAVSKDKLSTLKRTRADLAERAGHLERALRNDGKNPAKVGRGGGEVVISIQHGLGNDFRGQELGKLREGIARTTAAINITIGSMYRESSRMQEIRHAQDQAKADEHCEDEAREDERTGLDIKA